MWRVLAWLDNDHAAGDAKMKAAAAIPSIGRALPRPQLFAM
jgi:hypothetical protein